jgi:hypothetical protein
VTSDADHPQERLPGCGLAAYAGILLFIGGAGAVGLTFSWYTLVTGSEALAPTRLSYGGVVDPAVLAPMRAAGLLGADEVADAFHAELPDGSSACAIVNGKVVRLSAEGKQSVDLAGKPTIGGSGAAVSIAGAEGTVVCPFREGEGGEAFLRMLQSR